jgi:hypothetical protein
VNVIPKALRDLKQARRWFGAINCFPSIHA